LYPAIFDDVAEAASGARMITRELAVPVRAFSLSVKRINKYEWGH